MCACRTREADRLLIPLIHGQENLVTAAQPQYEVSLSAREALWAKIQQMAEYRADQDPAEP
jgi:hypothetical protein